MRSKTVAFYRPIRPARSDTWRTASITAALNQMTVVNPDLEAALDAEPNNWALRAVYADWLEEHEDMEEAALQRWMVDKQKCPMKAIQDDDLGLWHWCQMTRSTMTYWPSNGLARWLFCQLESGTHYTRREAEQDLKRALRNKLPS